MKLFGKKKQENTCCCADKYTAENMQKAESKKQETGIKILGSGCSKCRQLEKSTRQAIQELDLDLNVEHITDFTQIASYGVMSTPTLVVNGKVVSFGKVLSVEEVKSIIKEI